MSMYQQEQQQKLLLLNSSLAAVTQFDSSDQQTQSFYFVAEKVCFKRISRSLGSYNWQSVEPRFKSDGPKGCAVSPTPERM